MKNILSDVKIELLDEFDRNFERKAFFDEPWEKRKRRGNGSLLVTSGRLRRSISATMGRNSITFSSDTEYAEIHNSGGVIPVTPKMRKYFWYRHIKAKKPGEIPAKGSDAEFWGFMARAKKVTIPKRQFIGKHPRVTAIVKEVANDCTKEALNRLFTEFKNKIK